MKIDKAEESEIIEELPKIKGSSLPSSQTLIAQATVTLRGNRRRGNLGVSSQSNTLPMRVLCPSIAHRKLRAASLLPIFRCRQFVATISVSGFFSLRRRLERRMSRKTRKAEPQNPTFSYYLPHYLGKECTTSSLFVFISQEFPIR